MNDNICLDCKGRGFAYDGAGIGLCEACRGSGIGWDEPGGTPLNLFALVADAEETAVWQWKRELDALGYVEPPQTPPVVDDDAE